MRLAPTFFLLVLALAGCGGREAKDQLKVGMELAYPPFEMTDEQGRPTGVSVDLAEALGQALGRPVKIENLPFNGLIVSLKTGKIDLIISSMTATEERRRSIDFSDPYLQTGLALLIGQASPVHGAGDLNAAGRRLVVKEGTTGQLYAAEHLPQAQVRALDQENACVLEVVQGKADAFIYDQFSTLRNWERHRDTTRASLEPLQTESWAIGLRQGNDELRVKVNAFIASFKAAHGFERLGDRWLAEPKREFAAAGVPFVF